MSSSTKTCLLVMLIASFLGVFLAACGSELKLGDTTAVREANSLAIECKTDQALAALDRATREGGLGAAVADLQRVVILRDAGRMAEAEIAMNERNRRWNADAKNVAESEAAVTKAVNELRANRQEKTGQTICH